MLSALSTPAAAVAAAAMLLDSGLPPCLAFLDVDICVYCSDWRKVLSLQMHASASLAACVFVSSDTMFAD